MAATAGVYKVGGGARRTSSSSSSSSTSRSTSALPPLSRRQPLENARRRRSGSLKRPLPSSSPSPMLASSSAPVLPSIRRAPPAIEVQKKVAPSRLKNTNTFAVDRRFFVAMGVTAGEAMDRLVHDGVLTEDDVRKYRLMLAAEDDEAAKVLVEYEREGPNPAAIESFQKRALPILERARSLEKELQSEGKMISPVPTPLEIPTAEAIDVRQPGSPYNSSHTVQNIVNGLAAAAFADKNAGGGVRKRRVVLVANGCFNPIHKQNMRRFYLARKFLEGRCDVRVVGGIVSPAHPTVVRQKHRFRPREIIPPRHRLAMARVAVGESKWISVDAWAITRKRIVDYMGILEHTRTFLQETFPTESQDLLILYMVKSSQILTLNPEYLRAGGFGLITVCRPVEMDRLKLELSQAVFSDIVFIVEDNAVLSTDIERVTSATVRQALMSAQPVRTLVGNGLERYMKEMKVGEKLRGDQKWTIEDKIFRFEQDDKADRPYHKLPPTHMRRLSQMPLQH